MSLSLNAWGNSVKPLSVSGCFRELPDLICKDGFGMSLQASSGHYCYPQKLCVNFADYEEFEVKFLGRLNPQDCEFLESAGFYQMDDPEAIYEFVHRQIVEALIASHGGIAD
jgi:hypothetical protein